jgi:UDP-2-acetamido-3-amino-2,3-dideoxy-glucuronate N-acetyltransferase
MARNTRRYRLRQRFGRVLSYAAGAVVTKPVPAYALMAGVPAKRIGWVSKAGIILDPDLTCSVDNLTYRETEDGRLEPVG